MDGKCRNGKLKEANSIKRVITQDRINLSLYAALYITVPPFLRPSFNPGKSTFAFRNLPALKFFIQKSPLSNQFWTDLIPS